MVQDAAQEQWHNLGVPSSDDIGYFLNGVYLYYYQNDVPTAISKSIIERVRCSFILNYISGSDLYKNVNYLCAIPH